MKKMPDPNFHIYLAFGQSNMEGYGNLEPQDISNVPERFKMMAAVDFPSKGRLKGNWYKADPPLCRDWTGLSPCDYFGRELISKLPETISIGIINVSIPACSIDVFDEDKLKGYIAYLKGSWVESIAKEYENNPYKVLVDMGKKAKESGVIKGILLHQGETDMGDENWPNKVKKIYERLLNDLELNENDVPLLVGEVIESNMGGKCGKHNDIIAKIPNVINNAHVVKSSGLNSRGDYLHFSEESYRELGRRYAQVMLSLLKHN